MRAKSITIDVRGSEDDIKFMEHYLQSIELYVQTTNCNWLQAVEHVNSSLVSHRKDKENQTK